MEKPFHRELPEFQVRNSIKISQAARLPLPSARRRRATTRWERRTSCFLLRLPVA